MIGNANTRDDLKLLTTLFSPRLIALARRIQRGNAAGVGPCDMRCRSACVPLHRDRSGMGPGVESNESTPGKLDITSKTSVLVNVFARSALSTLWV